MPDYLACTIHHTTLVQQLMCRLSVYVCSFPTLHLYAVVLKTSKCLYTSLDKAHDTHFALRCTCFAIACLPSDTVVVWLVQHINQQATGGDRVLHQISNKIGPQLCPPVVALVLLNIALSSSKDNCAWKLQEQCRGLKFGRRMKPWLC